MNLEFRQRPRSIYGKNGSTPATQFAMIMRLHVISTPWTQGRFIPFVPIQRKSDRFSFRCKSHLFLSAQGERANANRGSTPPRSTLQSTSASIGSTDHLPTDPCPGPRRSFYTFYMIGQLNDSPAYRLRLHLFHFTWAFFGDFDGSLGLMLPQGFGDPIAGFAYPHNETRRDTPYLTIGHTPLSFGGFATSSRGAFAFRSHFVSTSATHVPGHV